MSRSILLLDDDLSPITSAYLQKVHANGGNLNQQEVNAYKNLENDLKRSGLITDNKTTSPIQRLNLFAGDSLATALVPFIAHAGSSVDVNNGIVSSEYGRAKGLKGVITSPAKYLATGYSPAIHSAVEDRFCGVWEFTKGSVPFAVSLGSCDGLNKAYNLLNLSGDTSSYQFFYDNGSEGSVVPYSENACFWTGVCIGDRTLVYKNGVPVFDATSIFTQPLTLHETYIFALNVAGEAQYLSDVRLGAYVLGFGMTPAKARSLYDSLSKFNLMLGRD